MTGFLKTHVGAAAVMLLCGIGSAAAGPLPVAAAPPSGASGILDAQYYGYGYPPYYRRPYGYYRPYGVYRPYGYGPGPRFYGPGAAKERSRTRLDFCKNQPQRC